MAVLRNEFSHLNSKIYFLQNLKPTSGVKRPSPLAHYGIRCGGTNHETV